MKSETEKDRGGLDPELSSSGALPLDVGVPPATRPKRATKIVSSELFEAELLSLQTALGERWEEWCVEDAGSLPTALGTAGKEPPCGDDAFPIIAFPLPLRSGNSANS